jgi:hypothetical protein
MNNGFDRLDVGQWPTETLTMNDLAAIYEARKTTFGPEFWQLHLADKRHYSLIASVESPFDFRLLYHTWLWGMVLTSVTEPTCQPCVIELLPGSSLCIPVALESIEYRGVLVQLNDDVPRRIPEWFHFGHAWLAGKLVNLACRLPGAGAIVGNHIIDDLLFDHICAGCGDKRLRYSDVALCKATWASLAESSALGSVQEAMTGLFRRLVQSMSYPSKLILRHHPSTFALTSGDLPRVNTEMAVFRAIARALRGSPRCEVYYLDASRVNMPAGLLYPASFLVVEKR